jgi:hypothetical protein
MRFLSVSLMVALLAFAVPSFAAPAVDEAGAAKLKKEVEDALAFSLKISESTGEGMKTEGPVQVTPSGSYYQVKIPGVRFDMPGGRLNVGNVVMNASPADDGAYLVSAAIPTRMTFSTSANPEAAVITIGEQKSASVWYPAYNNVTKMDASYGNVAVVVAGKDGKSGFDIKLAQGKVVRNMVKNADGTWSGPDSVSLNGLSFASADQKGSVSIGSIAANSVTDQLDMTQLQALQKKVEDAISSAMVDGAKQSDPAVVKSMVDEMLNDKSTLMNGFSSALEASDVRASFTSEKAPADASKPAETKTSTFGLAKLGYGLSIKDIKKEKGSIGFKVMMDGLNISDAPTDIAGMIPTSSNIDITLDSLPMQKLSQTFTSLIRSSMDAALEAQGAASGPAKQKAQNDIMMAIATLPQTVTEAGSSVSVRNTHVTAPDISGTLDGSFTMKQGKMTLAFGGLDELIAKLQAATSSAKDPSKVAQMVQSLTMLQMSGQNQPGADGKSKRVYVFELTADGKFLMNGADMSAMMGMMGGGLGGAKAKPVPGQPIVPTP